VSRAIAVEAVAAELGGRRVLDGISVDVGTGEILGVLGPSGCGKTTLLRLMLGLLAPVAGEVSLDGLLASAPGRVVVPPEQRCLAVVFQDLALWPHLSVSGNLEFGLAAHGVGRAERRERVAAMLDRVGLAGFESRRPGELSGGERQRVAIGRALVGEPRAALFDEPLTNLDAVRRTEMRRLLGALLRAQSTAAVYVAHDVRELAGLADRIAVLEAGRLAQVGTLEALRMAPATPFIRSLLTEEERS